jgi:phosphoglycerate dehydrogenase-like enzyme
MAEAKSIGHFRAERLYSNLDEIDGYIAEAAGIIHKPKVSAEDMKKVEQLKNLARTKIGCGNLRRDLLMGWDKLVKVLDTLGGKARKSA